MKVWMVPVVVAALGIGVLLFLLPLNRDVSYTCRSAAATLADPADEPGAPPGFFDEAKVCNRDARRRGTEAMVVALVGAIAAIGLGTSKRYCSRGTAG